MYLPYCFIHEKRRSLGASQTVDKAGIFFKNMPAFLLENLLKYTSIGYI